VTLHANSITKTIYNNKSASSETLTSTGTTVTVNRSVYYTGQTMTVPKKSLDVGRLFNAHFQSYV